MTPSQLPLRTTSASLAIVAAMILAALIPWWPIYAHPAFFAAVGIALAVGLAVAVFGTRSAWPAWGLIVAAFVGFVLFGVAAAIPSRAMFGVLPTPAGIAELLAGAVLSWKRLVTIETPVGTYQALLVPVYMTTIAATVAAASIALRARIRAFAVVPPLVLLMLGISFGVVGDDLAVETGLMFLLATVIWFAYLASSGRTSARRAERGAARRPSRILGGAALIAVTLVGATAASLAFPPGDRTVVRSVVEPKFDPRDSGNPLVAFRTAFDESGEPAIDLDVTGLDGRGLRLVTLDRYDGITYSVGGTTTAASGQFTRFAYRLDQSTAPGRAASIGVVVREYTGVWLPGIGRLEQIDFAGPRSDQLAEGFFYSDATGDAAVDTGLRAGDAYHSDSIAVDTPAQLDSLEPGTTVQAELPELPEEVMLLLEKWAPGTEEPGARLEAVITGIARDGYVSHGGADEPPSRSGHSLDRMSELVTADPMVGDGEQYAVLAALMARSIGFPARVVVGYMPGPTTAVVRDSEGNEVTQLSAEDHQAWIEVQDADGAWVPINPNPPARDVPEKAPEQPSVVSRPQAALAPPENRTPVDELADDTAAALDDPEHDDMALPAWLVAAAGWTVGILVLLSVLASPLLAVLLAKARRRRIRRNAGTSSERIEGGWNEFADTARDHGFRVDATSTRAEQAAMVGGLGPLVLASMVDRAIYAPDGSDESDDERVWSAVDALHRTIASPRTRWQRFRAAISIASLTKYAGGEKGARQ